MNRIKMAELHEQTANALRLKERNGQLKLDFLAPEVEEWSIPTANVHGICPHYHYRIRAKKYREYTPQELGAKLGEEFLGKDNERLNIRRVDSSGAVYSMDCMYFTPYGLLCQCKWPDGSKMGVEIV